MTLRDLHRRMDRLSDQLGMTTISPTIMQAMVDLHRRAGTEQQAPPRCTTDQDVTMHIESMHPTQPGD